MAGRLPRRELHVECCTVPRQPCDRDRQDLGNVTFREPQAVVDELLDRHRIEHTETLQSRLGVVVAEP